MSIHNTMYCLKLISFSFTERNVPRNITRYFCPNKCGKSYKAPNTLNRHVKYECGDLRRFRCPCCFKTFKQKATMQGHAAAIHKWLIK